jgi:hypothetical protein
MYGHFDADIVQDFVELGYDRRNPRDQDYEVARKSLIMRAVRDLRSDLTASAARKAGEQEAETRSD